MRVQPSQLSCTMVPHRVVSAALLAAVCVSAACGQSHHPAFYEDVDESLDDLEFDEHELEALPEEDATQYIPYRLSETLNSFLEGKVSREDLLDPSTIVRRTLEDPMDLDDVLVEQSDIFSSLRANLSKIRITGLGSVRLDEVVANMSGQEATVRASVNRLTARGLYNLSASMAFFSFDGAESFAFHVADLRLHVKMRLALDANARVLRIVDAVDAHLEAGDTDLQLAGLPPWSSSVVSLLSGLVFDSLRDHLLTDIRSDFKERANRQLEKLVVPKQLNLQQDNDVLDSLLQNANSYIRSSKKDPLKLPPYISRVKQDLFLLVFLSELRLTRGSLGGLSSMRRSGDVVARYVNRTLAFVAQFDLHNLTGSYDWHAHVMGLGPAGVAEVSVSKVTVSIEIVFRLQRRARLALQSLKASHVGHIETAISGLGSGDPVTELIVTLASNAFRTHLANWFMNGCHNILQTQLSRVRVQLLV